ncbi:MAG TPA: hypothetical protein PKC70_11650, partial [Cellvibrionaceae bacterium]|nr:hypothetical protein [Cellvibrionaceae bacterium]
MYKPKISVRLGQSGADFLAKNNLPAKGYINKQPAGVNFYEYDWSVRHYGSVLVEHGPYSFNIPHALSVMGNEDVAKMQEGLSSFFICAGISGEETIYHDEARKIFYAFLHELVSQGWRYYTFYSEPRLTGFSAFRYYLENGIYTIPVDYMPTLDEWMHIDGGEWRLYAG